MTSGDITEVFACGTAAVITPVGELKWEGGPRRRPRDRADLQVRQALVDVQYGRAEDTFGWMRQVV